MYRISREISSSLKNTFKVLKKNNIEMVPNPIENQKENSTFYFLFLKKIDIVATFLLKNIILKTKR